jgi:Putative DNA-binding domain
MNPVYSSLFKCNPNESINDSLKSSLFIKIDNELIKGIFSFIDQQNSRRRLLFTCRAFLKLGFESFDKYIYTSASLTQAVQLKSLPTIQHLCDARVNPPINKKSAFDLAKKNSAVTIEEFLKAQEVDVAFENRALLCVKKILITQGKPVLIMNIGNALQSYAGKDSAINLKIREKFGGLLKLLERYPNTFEVTGLSPRFMVSWKKEETRTENNRPSQPVSVPLSYEMVIVTTYKTMMCKHFINTEPCPTELCKFVHANELYRRNPLSPFFVSYDSTLCPTYKEGKNGEDGICDHGKSCLQSCSKLELQYHPENYHVSLCPSTATRVRWCQRYAVCSFAHHATELKSKFITQGPSVPLAFFARNQMWGKVIAGITQLPNTDQPHLKEAYPFSNETVLHYAAKYCKPEVILALLKKFPNLDMNPRDIFGQTPIHKTAAYAGGKDEQSDWQQTIDLLIKNKADPLLRDFNGYDVFYFAKKNAITMNLRTPLAFKIKNIVDSLYEKEILKEPNTETDAIEEEKLPETADFAPPNSNSSQTIAPSSSQVGHASNTESMCIEGQTIKKSSLTEFITVSKDTNLLTNLPKSFTPNFLAFLNTIRDGEIAKIYFGIDDNKHEGKIVGVVLNKKQRDDLSNVIWEALNYVKPSLTSREFDVKFIPICSEDKKVPIENLFVVEIQVKNAIRSVYFCARGLCWSWQNGKIKRLIGPQIISLCKARLPTQKVCISSNRVLTELNPKLLKDLPVEELEGLAISYQKVVEVRQQLLETLKNTLEEKEQTQEEEEQALFMEKEKEIAVLKEQIAAVNLNQKLRVPVPNETQ